MLRHMSGHDPKDSTSVDKPVPDFEAALAKKVRGMKIGIPREYRVEGMLAEVDALWQQGIDWFKAAGAEIREISLPHTKYALPAYYIVAPAEASSTSPATTACATACASTAATSPACMRRRARRASAPRSSAAC